jgi:photosystem II stability/assembly factor-like uncharacterized protein
MFVSVGNGGTIITSLNGSTWAKQTTNITSDFLKIIYTEGMFVIIGNDGIYSSQDGFTWTLRSSELPSKKNLWK